MANGFNPYSAGMLQMPGQATQSRSKFDDSVSALVQKRNLRDEFLDERDAALKKIEEEENKGFFKNPLAKLVMGFIPGGSELMMLDNLYRGDKLKGLIDKLPGFEKFEGTFLGDDVRKTTKAFDDMKMSTSDILASGIADYMGSKMMSKSLEDVDIGKSFEGFAGKEQFKNIWGTEDGFFEKLLETGKHTATELPSSFVDLGTKIGQSYGSTAQANLETLNFIKNFLIPKKKAQY
tara:strand:- start:14209 stop:14913 length:705 start_codon:yes stop_codon:yes gene_type:complete